MKENLSSLNEVFKGAALDGSVLLRCPIAAVLCFWSGSAVLLLTILIRSLVKVTVWGLNF